MKVLLSVLFSFSYCLASMAADAADPTTQVLKWKDGKKAVFLLAFDDGAPSQILNVIPELEKRKISGTFYLVTGNSLYANTKRRWEAAVKSPYVVAANHTFTHKGATSADVLDQELAKCNEVLYQYHPERKKPRLIGFGKPGGVPWTVTNEEVSAALAKHHLVNRPPFQGPPMHFKSAQECIAAVDKAISSGEMGHLDFHGVGEDWLVTPLDWFTALLDKLEASRDVLWVTDVVSWHQYATERKGASVKTLKNDKDGIQVELTSSADPTLYDLPLTLQTKVPSTWTECVVEQGATKTPVKAANGVVEYSAIPGSGVIQIRSK